LPVTARIVVLSVVLGYVASLTTGVSSLHSNGRELITEMVFAAATVLSIEVSVRLAWPRTRRDRLSRDFLGVWLFPISLLLPVPYALVAVIVPYSYLQLQASNRQPVKILYNLASAGLAYGCAAFVHEIMSGAPQGALHVDDLIGTPRRMAAVLVAAAACWIVNHLLVGGIVAVTSGKKAVRDFLRDREGLTIDVVDMAVGAVAAILWTVNPFSLVFLLPPVLLMQHQLFSGLRQAVRTDLLTEVANPQFWRETAAREIERASASGSHLAVLMVDIDHFKQVNDKHGHLAGDEVLAAVARTISKALRPGDLVGRLGGEEFGAILAGQNLLDAEGAAERLRKQVSDVKVRSDHGEWISVTVSVGVAELSVSGTNLHQLLDAADTALYVAKRAGRNQVRVAGSRTGQVIDLRPAEAADAVRHD
jgi:diguanylate cyclase (GGDEF)-like protein